ETMHGLGWYDYGKRFYDPNYRLSFISVDPLCEKYYSISPYAYCMNNPIKFVDLKGDSISVPEQYKEQFLLDMHAVFGDKASLLSFNTSGNLVLNGGTKEFIKGMSKDQKKVFKGLNETMVDEQITSVVYENNYELTIGGEMKSIDIVKEYGGGVYSKVDNTIVIAPNVGTVNVTLDQIQFINGVIGLPTQNVLQNTTSALFHEIGERNTSNINFRGGVIDYENYVRKIIRLPMRPFDLNHSKKVRTNYK
ncbi:RHS repeat-associated core domain-containing protein, partial [Bacteroides salyersiae]